MIGSIPEHLVDAYLRAHGRENTQRMGGAWEDLDDDTARVRGYLMRPDECLPYQITEMIARGKVLARRFGW